MAKDPHGGAIGTLLADAPVVVRVGPILNSPYTGVSAYRLSDSQRIGDWPVAPFPLTTGKYGAETKTKAVAGRMAVMALDGSIYAVSLEEIDSAPLPEPPHFVPRQSRFTLASKGPTKLTV